MEQTNIPIVKFNSPEEAYLYGLGQAIANAAKIERVNSGFGHYEFEYREQLINNINQKAMDFINNKKS